MKLSLTAVRFFAVVASLSAAGYAEAQTCNPNLCPAGTRFGASGVDAFGPWGDCNQCNWFGYCSHTVNRCPAGSTLDFKAGTCALSVCSGSSCGAQLPICDPNQTFSSGVDVFGPFAECTESSNGYIAHEVRRCATGWQLQPGNGTCLKLCLADLFIKYAYLKNLSNSVVSTVRAGQPYFLCADVQNIGGSTSASTLLTGGGLGVPSSPTVLIPGLAPASSAERCLFYSSAPSPGTYHLGISVNLSRGAPESNFGNNSYTVTVTTTP